MPPLQIAGASIVQMTRVSVIDCACRFSVSRSHVSTINQQSIAQTFMQIIRNFVRQML